MKSDKEKRKRMQMEENLNKITQLIMMEVPVTHIGRILASSSGLAAKGNFCGGGCNNPDGDFCGLGCQPVDGAWDVVDPVGRVGLSYKEVEMVRKELPKLRELVAGELKTIADKFTDRWSIK